MSGRAEKQAESMEAQGLLTPARLVELSGKSRETVYRYLRDGVIPKRVITGTLYVTVEDAVKWLGDGVELLSPEQRKLLRLPPLKSAPKRTPGR